MRQAEVRGSNRRAWSAVLILACIFICQGSGCDSGDDTTIINGGDTLIASLFPGTPISDNNKGNDGVSLSNGELVVNQGYVVFRNASNNTAIILHTEWNERLWAYFFDGSTITPPVEIQGANQLDYDEDLGIPIPDPSGGSDDGHVTWRSYQVLFLNTASSGNPNASARNGDAIIIWNKSDLTPPAGADPDADANFRLYGSYFDRSLAATPVNGDIRYGFDTTATPIDFDNQNPGVGNDDNVSAAGFVSDSLVLTHAYPVQLNGGVGSGDGGDDNLMHLEEPTLSGDPTTFVYIVWRKAQNDGSGSSTGARYHQVEFNLGNATNVIPSEASLGAGVLPLPGGVTIPAGSDVDGAALTDSGFVVHNGAMIWRSPTTTNTGLFLTRFAAGGSISTIELGDTIASGQPPDLPLKTNVYGGDHGGLTSLYAFFEAGDNLHVSKSDLDSALARETSDISNTPGDGGVEFEGTRINRTSDWIMALWSEFDAAANQVFARAVQTRGPGDGARTLANSLSAVVKPANQDATLNVDYVTQQSEIADGMQNPGCGVQSNRNRINFAFQQRNPADTVNQRLLHNGVVFTADVTGSAPPTAVAALLGATDGLVAEHDTTYSFISDDLRPVLTDLGDSSGAPVLYFLRNDNNPTDAAAAGAFTEIRVFGAPGVPGALATLMGADGTLVDNTLNDPMFDTGEDPLDELNSAGLGDSNFLRLQTTPLNPNVGSSPNHGGTTTHVFWQEAKGGGNSLWSLRTRAFQKNSFSPAIPLAFGNSFSPVTTSPPITLDGTLTQPAWIHPTFKASTDDVGTIGVFVTVSGNTVGLYFHSDEHFFYQEYDGNSWYLEGGLGDPQQIDNKYGGWAFVGQDQMGYAFPGYSNTSCDNIAGTIALFVRNIPGDDPHSRRLFARIHN